MKMLTFEVGDDAWIHGIGTTNKKYKGKVVHKFKLDNYYTPLYVIEIDTHVDPIFEVRCGMTMSDSEHLQIGFYRRD